MQKEDLKQFRDVVREEVENITKPLSDKLNQRDQLFDVLGNKAVEHDERFTKIDQQLKVHDEPIAKLIGSCNRRYYGCKTKITRRRNWVTAPYEFLFLADNLSCFSPNGVLQWVRYKN